MNIAIGISIGLFTGLTQYLYFRVGRSQGFKSGVLEGYMIGKFPGSRVHKDYPAAQKIIDELEAHMVWKITLEQPIEDAE